MYVTMLVASMAWTSGGVPADAASPDGSGIAAGHVVAVSAPPVPVNAAPASPAAAPLALPAAAPPAAAAASQPQKSGIYYGCLRAHLFGSPKVNPPAPTPPAPATNPTIIPTKAEQPAPASPGQARQATPPAPSSGFFSKVFRFEDTSKEDRRWESSRTICPD